MITGATAAPSGNSSCVHHQPYQIIVNIPPYLDRMPPFTTPHFVVDTIHLGIVREYLARLVYDVIGMSRVPQQSLDSL